MPQLMTVVIRVVLCLLFTWNRRIAICRQADRPGQSGFPWNGSKANKHTKQGSSTTTRITTKRRRHENICFLPPIKWSGDSEKGKVRKQEGEEGFQIFDFGQYHSEQESERRNEIGSTTFLTRQILCFSSLFCERSVRMWSFWFDLPLLRNPLLSQSFGYITTILSFTLTWSSRWSSSFSLPKKRRQH